MNIDLQTTQCLAGLRHSMVVFHLRPLQNEDRGRQAIWTPFRAYMLVVVKGGDRELEGWWLPTGNGLRGAKV